MKRRTMLVFMLAVLASVWSSSVWSANKGLSVYVIAPSVSTSMEARAIRQRNSWTEATDARTADAILVVCRSSLFNPLNDRYDSLKELEKDADDQLNIAGPKFHIYLFQLQGDLSVSQLKHTSYEAN
jgi:hypothetical protein